MEIEGDSRKETSRKDGRGQERLLGDEYEQSII
jgi:hypothetical protein